MRHKRLYDFAVGPVSALGSHDELAGQEDGEVARQGAVASTGVGLGDPGTEFAKLGAGHGSTGSGQAQDQPPPTHTGRCLTAVAKVIMYEVTPDEFVLLTPDGLHLIVEPVAKPLDRVLEEGQYVTAGLTGAFQSTVVGGSGKSVVIAQQVGRGGRHSRVDQDGKLQQSRRAPVAVAERAYPGDVEVSDDGLDQGVDDFKSGEGAENSSPLSQSQSRSSRYWQSSFGAPRW